jgi:hypothetical protein
MSDDYDYEDEGDITDLYDDEDDDAADCQQFLDGGVIVCGALGSEWCDFECPLRRDVGLTPKEAEDRAIEEIGNEITGRAGSQGCRRVRLLATCAGMRTQRVHEMSLSTTGGQCDINE